MQTDFSAQATTAPQIPSAMTPQEGVVNKTTSTTLAGIGNLFDQASGILTKNNESKAAKIVADFSSQQLLVADGLEQGSITSSAHARALMRKNLLEAINAHPDLAQQFISADSSLSGLPAGTGVAREGTDAEQRVRARNDYLASNGLARPDATDTEFEAAALDWEATQSAISLHNTRMGQIDEQLKLNSLASSERERLKAERSTLITTTARAIAPAERTKMQNDFDAIIKDTNISETDKQIAVEDYYNKWLSEVSSTLGELEGQDASYMLKPFEELKTLYIARANGSMNDAELKRNNDRIIEEQKAITLADPTLAAIASTTGMFDSNLLALAGSSSTIVFNKVLERVAASSAAGADMDAPSPFVSSADDKQALKLHLNLLTSNLNSSDPKVAEAGKEQLSKYVSMMEEDAGKIQKDPTKAIEIVNWLGSSGFLAAKKAHPELFDNMDATIEMMKANYQDEVMSLVEKQFTQNHIVMSAKPNEPGATLTSLGWLKQANANQMVVATPTASGVNFSAIDTKDPKAVALASQLNKDLKPVINNTVRAFAHLEGRTDYGAYWGEVSGQVLNGDIQGQAGDSRLGGSAANDQLSMSDFGEPLAIDPNSPVRGGAGWTEVVNPSGETVRRTGARSWRNNNPGNIEYGTFAKSHGAIGSDGRFAVFPSYEAGRSAKESLLFESKGYAGKTIEEAINRYAPPSENDSGWYASSVAEAIGVDVNTPLSSLSQEQRMAMLDAMQVVEGWRVGKETKVSQ
jgi:hypothetical protein